MPQIPGLSFQAVHSYDIGDAYRLAAVGDVRGAFNIAAPPVLDTTSIARQLRARTFGLSARAARGLASVAYHARLTPLPPDWLGMGLAGALVDPAPGAQG